MNTAPVDLDTEPFTSPAQLRAVWDALGLDVADLAELFDVSHRSAERWLISKPAPPAVQATIQSWVEAFENVIDQAVDTATGTTPQDPVILYTYARDSDLPRYAGDDQIWWFSPKAYAAHRSRLLLALVAAKIPVDLQPTQSPRPLYSTPAALTA